MSYLRLPLPFLLGVALLAACSSDPRPAGSGGDVADSGPTSTTSDAGSTTTGGPQPVGGACQSSADCTSGQCYTGSPGGYCLDSCGTGNGCPSGSSCVSAGSGQMVCLATCNTNADCRTGYVCAPGAQVCAPGCQSDSQCGSGNTCDTSTGLCSSSNTNMMGGGTDGGNGGGTNTIGQACAQDSACTFGSQPWCITDADGFPQGSCTNVCTAATDCGSGNPCVGGLATDQNNSPISICMKGCSSSADCRSGYDCVQYMGQQFCAPQQMMMGGTDGGMMTMGGTDGGSTNTGGTDGGSVAPGSHPAAPQVQNFGGPVLASPKIVPIFFSNDDATTVNQIIDFDSKVGASSYWTGAVSEYGVGPATAAAAVKLTESSSGTITANSIDTWLVNKISSRALPTPDANTLYVIHYPSSTTITDGSGSSCQDFGGYHAEVQLNSGSSVAYAVIPRCAGQGGFSVLDMVTMAESHELIEAATDPYPNQNPAYAQVDDTHLFWDEALGGSEIGDMCAQEPDAFFEFSGLPYYVQRVWSNQAASAGHDPCQPGLPGQPYFNAAPVLTGTMNYSVGQGQSVKVEAVSIPAGSSKAITLDLFADGNAGTFDIQVQDMNELYGQPANLQFQLSKTSGQNGDQIQLTITPKSSGQNGYDMFIVTASQGQGQQQLSHSWIGLVAD